MVDLLSDYHWDPLAMSLNDDFFGYESITPMKPSTPTRARKVTITEILDEQDEWDFVEKDELMNDSCSSDEESDFNIDTEEVFTLLDDVINDWKIKLECIIGEGLKKIRKAGKEKKLAMKYLPGDGIKNSKLQEAKVAILKEWKADYQKNMGQTANKFEKLTQEKFKEVEGLFKNKLIPPENTQLPAKQKTYIDYKTGGGYHALKELMRELNQLCNTMNSPFPGMENQIPIYKNPAMKKDMPMLPKVNNVPLNLWLNLRNMIPKEVKTIQSNPVDVLDGFKVKHHKQISLVAKKGKGKVMRKGETNAVSAQRRMLERKAKKFVLREYKKNGQTRFLVTKKRVEKTVPEVEDIFQDWKENLVTAEEQRNMMKRKQRKRKLSHRAQRKEILKEIENNEKQNSSMSYADMLKKNLNLPKNKDATPMEDIYMAWRDYLKELDKMLVDNSKEEDYVPMEEYFKVWHHHFNTERYCKRAKPQQESIDDILASAELPPIEKQVECGKPTVKSVPKMNRSFKHKSAPVKNSKIVQNVNVNENWKPYVIDIIPKAVKTHNDKNAQIKQDYKQETFFQDWITNLNEPKMANPPQRKRSMKKRKSECINYEMETFLQDWRHNFNEPESFNQVSTLKRSEPQRKSRKRQENKEAEKVKTDTVVNSNQNKNKERKSNQISKEQFKKETIAPTESEVQKPKEEKLAPLGEKPKYKKKTNHKKAHTNKMNMATYFD